MPEDIEYRYLKVSSSEAKYSAFSAIPLVRASEWHLCSKSEAQNGNKWTLIMNVQNLQ